MISLSMNLLFGVPALAGPGRLKAGHHTDGTTQTGSWCQCTASKPWGLSMNLPLSLPSPPLWAGERVAEGRERGIRTGSWSQQFQPAAAGSSTTAALQASHSLVGLAPAALISPLTAIAAPITQQAYAQDPHAHRRRHGGVGHVLRLLPPARGGIRSRRCRTGGAAVSHGAPRNPAQSGCAMGHHP